MMVRKFYWIYSFLYPYLNINQALSPMLEAVRASAIESCSDPVIISLQSIESIVEKSQKSRAMKLHEFSLLPTSILPPMCPFLQGEYCFQIKLRSWAYSLEILKETLESHVWRSYLLQVKWWQLIIYWEVTKFQARQWIIKKTAPQNITFKSALDRIDELMILDVTPNMFSPSVEVIEGDAESLYKCGGVSNPAMFSIPTYIQAHRQKSVKMSSRPSNPCLEMTDGHNIHLSPEIRRC